MRRKPISAVMSAMLLLISPLLQAQDRCGDVGPSVAVGGGTAWQKGISVTLYIVSTTADPISSAQQMTISQSLTNWNSGAGSNLSVMTTVLTSPPSSPSPPYILVQVGSTAACGNSDGGATYEYNITTGNTTSAVIKLLATALGNSDFLRLMAHEMGHTYLLADCNPPGPAGPGSWCDQSLTVMHVPIDSSSGTGPLCCDSNRMAQITQGAGSGKYGTACF